ncbi:MAG TPA: (Fe-S)-binding protein [Methyloceanibacter sp.]|jgi:L-lactate dehydrogenase complex protein LldE|nr:(Fe-S)-binding protein [Methyloceanibacter sp.]
MTTKAVEKRPHVGLFVTCLVDFFRPSVGFAAIKLLEDAGARVEFPERQTCCGQPAYNSGDREDAKAIARDVIATFEQFDYVVAPSGSCAGMLKVHHPSLLADDPAFAERANALAAKSHELTSFLVEVLGVESVTAKFGGSVTYHDSCSSLRELKVHDAPRTLLRSVEGLNLTEMAETEVCCGFGGAFAVKYPAISSAIDDAKVRNIANSGASCLVAGDLGCLLHIAGRLSRDGSPVACRHVAEVLAGMTDAPAIGQARKAG